MSREKSDRLETQDDRVPILSEYLGVQTKNNSVVVEEIMAEDFDTEGRKQKDCGSKNEGKKPWKVNNNLEVSCLRYNVNLSLLFALVGVCLVAVVLLLATVVCNFGWDGARARDIEILQERLKRLEERCALAHPPQQQQQQQQPPHPFHHDDTQQHPGDDVSGNAELLWQQEGTVQSEWVASAAALQSRAKQSTSPISTHIGDNENFDDDDGDDDDENEDEEQDDDEGFVDDSVGRLLSRLKRSAEKGEKKKKPRDKRKPRQGGRHCKKVERCLKDRESGKKASKKCQKLMQCPQIEKVAAPPLPPQPVVQPFVPKAVHFMSDFWNDRRMKDFGQETPLKFLRPAPWMAQEYRSESMQPITSLGDGGYNVTQPGLYLIYSSVMFHDNKPRQSQALVVNGNKLFKCMDSVDYIDTDLPAGDDQAKYKSCVMTGVTHLRAGDRLEIQNLYANTEIDLSTDATYFGAVLLSPGTIKINH